MARNWTRSQTTPTVTKLANLALKAQKLVIQHRLAQVQTLINSHAPDFKDVPGGKEALNKARAQLAQAYQQLRLGETTDGRRR